MYFLNFYACKNKINKAVRETIQMDSAEALITTEADPRTLAVTITKISKHFNNKRELKDILKRIFSSCLADGPILAGNTFSAIQPKLNSLAVQTELTLLDSKMERSSKDLTEARELIQLLIRLILNSKLHTDDSSNNQSKYF